MLTVEQFRWWTDEPLPGNRLRREIGVAGLLMVDTDDGRRLGLPFEDLLDTLNEIALGHAVVDLHRFLSLTQFPLAGTGNVELQLRIGLDGDEVASWRVAHVGLMRALRSCWSEVESHAYSSGHQEFLFELQDDDGAWTCFYEAAQQLRGWTASSG